MFFLFGWLFLFAHLVVSGFIISKERVNHIQTDYAPEQIHLSYTGHVESMFVTWTSLVDAEGNGSATFWVSGVNSSIFSVAGSKTRLAHDGDSDVDRYTYTYRATMQPLKPSTVYEYYVQCGDRISDTFSFKTFPESVDFKPVFAIYGDMGAQNHVSFDKLYQDVKVNAYDMVLHIGDFAYDLNDLMGVRGDSFMNLIQRIATKVPYNVAVGNHEAHNNFSEYAGRFTSPEPSVFYNSFDVGPIHFVMFSSEFYFFDNYGTGQLQAQYNWLAEDLAKANTPEARKAHPWIVTMAHRPMYCSSHDGDDCTKRNGIMRTGYQHKFYKLEELFYNNGVDLQFYAHEHDYERLYPIYQYAYQRVMNISVYPDPKYPVHVITGSAGCREMHDPFSYPQPKWSVVRSNDYGFTLFSVEDTLTLKIKQYSIVKAKFIDEFLITKSSDYPSFGN